MSTVTNYLKLRNISLQSTQWFSDFNFNIAKLDTIGKHLRLQTGAGQSLAVRAELDDGTLAEVIRVVPDGDAVSVYLGRTGRGDRVIIAATTLYTSIALTNQNPAYTSYKLDLGATWSDEDIGTGDDIQNVSLNVNPRNNKVTIMEVPPASTGAVDAAWTGSAMQLEIDRDTGAGTNKSYLKFTVSTDGGSTKNFLIPAYKL